MKIGKYPGDGDLAPKVHGADKHTDVTRELFLTIIEGYVAAGTPGNYQERAIVNGGADSDEPSIHFNMKVPDDFVSFTKVELLWLCYGVGNMYWKMSAAYAAKDEPYLTHTDRPALGVTANNADKVIKIQEPANPLTLASLASGDVLSVQVSRTGSDVLDTLDNIVYFLGLLFTYVAEQ